MPFVASGWLDTTRVAGGDAELWRQIFSTNRTHVLTALARYEGLLASLRNALAAGDDAKMLDLLVEAKRRRDGSA